MTTPPTVKTDSYKAGHFDQYPETQEMYAYGEFRKPSGFTNDDRLVFYGLRYIIRKHLERQWTHEDVDAAVEFYSKHNAGGTPYPYPEDLFRKIVDQHDGWVPIMIRALPEGSVVYAHVPVYTIEARGEFSRLVTFFETLLTQVWYTSNIATLSRHAWALVKEYFDKTVEPESHWLLASRLHDFGYRGATTEEAAKIGGSAHLLSFNGTDTMTAAWYVENLNGGCDRFAQSIPATEHSVMMSWPSEELAVMNMVNQFGSGVFATVADTYDYERFLREVLPQVAPLVKHKGGTHVVRPDSGDPVKCVLQGLEGCARAYGYDVNSLGYKVLQNSAVIQGDGINIHDMKRILDAVIKAGWSAQNVAFGMGAGLLQKHNRDTMAFATKLSYIKYADGRERDAMKVPTNDKNKRSLPGKLKVCTGAQGKLWVYPQEDREWRDFQSGDLLQPVYDCGPVPWTENFMQIRERLNDQWARLAKYHNPISTSLEQKMDKFVKELRDGLAEPTENPQRNLSI